LRDEDLEEVMAKYDVDGNGTISFKEFTTMVSDGLLLNGMLSEYKEAFNAVDKSGNGTIGKFYACIKALTSRFHEPPLT
jgi:Ca2+-binding EF-hand superfamily protein